MSDFKVGDKVEVIELYHDSDLKIGDTGTIFIIKDNLCGIQVDRDNFKGHNTITKCSIHRDWWVHKDRIILLHKESKKVETKRPNRLNINLRDYNL